MFKSLRGQLILSHILPALVIIPLMGIALVYFLETRLFIPGLERQLADDAVVIAKIARSQPQLFSDLKLAQSLLDSLELESATRIMVLDAHGILLASSNPEDTPRINHVLDKVGIQSALQGQLVKHVDFSAGLGGDVIDVFAPVKGPDNKLEGVIRVSYRFATVAEQLVVLRYLIVAVVSVAIVISAVLGLLLALNLDTPLEQVTNAIYDLSRGARTEALPERGPREVKTLQQAANFLVKRLRELEQSRRQLLANLVHELGRPVGGMRMGIQVLRKGAKRDPQVLDELLEGMEAETSLLQRLLDDLAHLHDQVIGGLELDYQEVDLNEWLPVVLRSAQEKAQKERRQWRIDVPEGLPEVKIDPDRMAQVIGNLTSNAIKFTPRGGLVSVEAGSNGAMAWIRVSDTGPGISPEEKEKIFEPFYRGSQQRRFKQGMGLGLSIARDLVIAHSGRLEVDSQPGEGSRFTIWLPLNHTGSEESE
jgi:two-component system sensor histidine kinase BaeS